MEPAGQYALVAVAHVLQEVLPGGEYVPAGHRLAYRDREVGAHQYPAAHWLALCRLCTSVTLKVE